MLLVGGGLHLAFFLPFFSPLQGPYGWKDVAEAARAVHAGLPGSAFYLGIGRKYTCTSQLAYQLRLPFKVHGAAELAIAAALPAMPWVLGFADHKAARNLCFGLAAMTLVVAALTDWDSDE